MPQSRKRRTVRLSLALLSMSSGRNCHQFTSSRRVPLVHTDILSKLQNSRYAGKNMRAHITAMRELREQLDDIGHPIDDASFAAYVRVSLGSTWRPYLSALQAGASASGKPLELETFLNALYIESDNIQAEKNISTNAEPNAAMSADARGKGKGRGSSTKAKRGQGKSDKQLR